MSQRTTQRTAFLDLLRIFSFICVLAGHKFYADIVAVANDPNIHITLRELAQLALRFFLGGAGVIIFFLVSGYLITYILMKESTSTSHFIIKRIFRIYPLYVFAVLLEVILAYFVQGTPMVDINILLTHLTLTGDLFDRPPYSLGVEWTLRIEILFYLLMALLKSTIWKYHKVWTLPVCYLLIIAFLQIFGPFPHINSLWHGCTTLYMPFLFLGSIVFLLEKSLINRNIGIFCILYILISYFVLAPIICPTIPPIHFVVGACFLFAVAWAFRDKLKASAFTTFVANLGYAVYLFHSWLWVYLIQLIEYIHGKNAFVLFETIVLLFVFCYLAHITIEKTGARIGVYFMRDLKQLPERKFNDTRNSTA